MAHFERMVWRNEHGVTRRERQPCRYYAYLPDALLGRRFHLSDRVLDYLYDVEDTVCSYDESVASNGILDSLYWMLLRAESVASSRIEGLEIGYRRLLRADAARRVGMSGGDGTARYVLNNIDAVRSAVLDVERENAITSGMLLKAHRRLMSGTEQQRIGGVYRETQNWIGGGRSTPCTADFVPPVPERVVGLMEDLVEFCNSGGLPALAQAATAHAQFETIHPFADGNGRVGRALIHMVLYHRLGLRVPVPVSLVLETWDEEYVAGLTSFRHEGDAACDDATEGLNSWVWFFAKAASRAVSDLRSFDNALYELRLDWRERMGSVRSDATVNRVIEALPVVPVLTLGLAVEMTERSRQSVNVALEHLVAAGVLKQVGNARRNRMFESPEVIGLLTGLDRRLASPEGDTRVSRPARRVPRRVI